MAGQPAGPLGPGLRRRSRLWRQGRAAGSSQGCWNREHRAGNNSCSSPQGTRPERGTAVKAAGLIARSPRSSGKSLGTECKRKYSRPRCLLQLRQQMGSLKTPETSPAPFPAVATLRLQLIPANTGELREDLEAGAAQRLGGTLSEEVLELGTLNQKEKLWSE